MAGALAKIAGKIADVGKDIVKGLLGTGQRIPKGHQATEPVDYEAIDSSTKVLGAIYKLMQRARKEELAQRTKNEKDHKNKIDDEDKRNQELIKALTVRRKPKKRAPPKKEAPKKEAPKRAEEKPKEKPTEKPTKKTDEAAKKQVDKEADKAKKQVDKEQSKAKKTAEKEQAAAKKKAEQEAKPKPKAEEVKPSEPPPKAEPAAAPKAPAQKPPSAGKLPSAPVAAIGVAGLLASSLAEAGITEKGQANILAQVRAETGFAPRSENLSYKSAKRIFEVFKPPRIPNEQFAQQFVNNPEALANHVYATTDGNSEPGDGYKYRGRGYLQHTGKNQYKAIAKYTGVDVISNPDLLNKPEVASKAVAWFFLDYKKKKPEQLENIAEVNKAVGFAGGKEEAAKRAEYAKEYSQNLPKASSVPVSSSAGNQVDQASKENKDIKEAAANAKKQQTVNNVGVNQTNTQTASSSNNPDYDDRSAYQKKKG
jgi:putative chitinase